MPKTADSSLTRVVGAPINVQELREVVSVSVNVMTGVTEISQRVVLKDTEANEIISDSVDVNYHPTDDVTDWIAEATSRSAERSVEIANFEQHEPVEPEA